MTSEHDEEETVILPKFHPCCGAAVTMAEMVFQEHTCSRTLRTMVQAVRTILEGRDGTDER